MVRLFPYPNVPRLAHDDGIVTIRLHYIPLSNSYQEIYNIHAFFSGPTEATLRAANSTTLELPLEERRPLDGDRRLRRIARAGKQWRRTFGRKEDMEGKRPHSPLPLGQFVDHVDSLHVSTVSRVCKTLGRRSRSDEFLVLTLSMTPLPPFSRYRRRHWCALVLVLLEGLVFIGLSC